MGAAIRTAVVLGMALIASWPAGALAFLWELESGGTKHCVVGAFGQEPARTHPRAAAVRACYRQARTIVLESAQLSLGNAESVNLLGLMVEPKAGGALPARLGPQLYPRLQAHLKTLGLPNERVALLKPWAIAAMLENFSASSRARAPLAGEYLHLARQDSKDTQHLYTSAESMAYLRALTADASREMLSAYLDEQERRDVQTWRAGDLAALTSIVDRRSQDYPHLQALNARLQNDWTPRIDAMLRSPTPHMVIVECRLLLGPRGILATLAARGLAPLAAPRAVAR